MTALLDTQDAIGTWMKLDSTTPVQIMAHAGFDFVVIDLEHTTLDLGTAGSMIAMANACGLTALVRVPDHTPSTVQRVLDAGADGILAPHVDDADDARTVAAACRFPPRGGRGSGSTGTAGRWGTLPRADYLRHGNDEVLCVVQIESGAGARNTAEIGAVEGIDALLIGAADLALDVGDAAETTRLIGATREAARASGVPCGSATGSAAGAREAFALGDAFVVCSNDTSMLVDQAMRIVADARADRT